MPPHNADGSAVARAVVKLALFGIMGLGINDPALAADHRISAQSAKFNCSSVRPGDTITIPAGERGPLKIYDCDGSASNPIIIRNDPDGNGPAVIRRTSGANGGFVFDCNHCVHVEIDGSYKWKGAPGGKTYGIKVTMSGGEGPSAFVRMAGLSRFFTIRNVEVDGAWRRLKSYGSGIRVNDNNAKRSNHPGLWREGILIEDNYIHDIKSEGMYIGPNYRNGELPLRNVEIRHNRVEDTGWEAINAKSMWEGNNSIHHNEVRRAGKDDSDKGESSQFSGIKSTSSTVKIYNNWVEQTGQHGIRVWTQDGPRESEGRGPFVAQIWNNVVVDAGALWRSFMAKSHGIGVGAEDGVEKPVPYIYNNTIVNARQGAIALNSNVGKGLVRDNVSAGAGSNPVIVAPGFITLNNNSVGTVSQMSFVNAGSKNFRLSTNSPAWNEGSNDSPPTDFDDIKRPKDGAPDRGAFEGKD
jgi:Right handed beta helix region